MTTAQPAARNNPIHARFYVGLDYLERASDLIFWLSAALSLAALFVEKQVHPAIAEGISIGFLVTVLIGTVAGLCVRLWLTPDADDALRKACVGSAYATPLSHIQPVGYYNNVESTPMRRLAANVLENSFFTTNIARKMLPTERAWFALYAVAFVALLAWRGAPQDWILWAAQLVFGEHILSRYTRLEWLQSRSARVYDEVFALFQAQHAPAELEVRAVELFTRYETVKAIAGIKLSTKVFERENAALSAEWAAIRRTLAFTM